jgi:hypothetical protein
MVMNSGPFEKLKGHLGGLLARLNSMAASGELQRWAETAGRYIMRFIDVVAVAGAKVWEVVQTLAGGASWLANFVGGWGNLAIAVASVKLAPVIGTLTTLGKLAMGHPIIALISLLASGALLVIANWDKITAWAAPYWESLKTIFIGAGQAISDFFFNWTPLGLIIKHWDGIKAYFSALPDQFAEFGRNIISSLGAGIDEKLTWIKSKITGLTDLLPDWMSDKLGMGEAASKKTPGVLPAVMAASLSTGAIQAGPALAAPSAQANTTVQASINVAAAPGMNEQTLAEAVAREVDKLGQQKAARKRAALYDEE